MSSPDRTDVLVVGGGPAGAATSYWLASAGHRVTCVERKTFPRDKTCGDGLTPRAVKQLADMGLYDELLPYHRYTGLRAVAHGVTLELNWPDHPVYPDHGFVVRRRDLDQIVFQHAADAGADCHQGTEAVSPIVEHGLVAQVEVAEPALGVPLATVLTSPGSASTVRVASPRSFASCALRISAGMTWLELRSKLSPGP